MFRNAQKRICSKKFGGLTKYELISILIAFNEYKIVTQLVQTEPSHFHSSVLLNKHSHYESMEIDEIRCVKTQVYEVFVILKGSYSASAEKLN